MARYATELFEGDGAQAAVVLAESWPELVELRGESQGEPALEFLFAVLRRRVLSAQREAGTMRRLEDDAAGSADAGSPDGESEEETAGRVFARLTPKQQEALRLKFTHGFRHGQIAIVLGLPSTHAAQLVHNALGRIARVLAVRRGQERPAGPDDPRLSLAALDEISPEEAAALNAAMPEAKVRTALVEELRGTARLVASAIARGRRRRRAASVVLSRRVVGSVVAAVGILALGGWWWWRSSEAPAGISAVESASPGASRVAVRAGEAGAAEEPRSGSVGADGAGAISASRGLVPGKTPSGPAAVKPGAVSRPVNGAGMAVARETDVAEAPPLSRRGRDEPVGTGGPAAESRGALAEVGKHQAEALARGERSEMPPAAPVEKEREREEHGPERATAKENGPADIAPILALRRALGAARWPRPEEVDPAALARYFSAATRSMPPEEGWRTSVERVVLPWRDGGTVLRAAATAGGQGAATRAAASVVLLLDVSASMDAPNRLPLVQEAVGALLGWLQPGDRVGLVTYAGEAQVLFPLTEQVQGERLRAAVFALFAAGRTNGGAGLAQAYALAAADRDEVRQAVVILCTDGEFNMGQSSEAELVELVDRHRAEGVRLAIFGFGRNGAIDPRLEALAARARGGSGYVNTRAEATAVLARQLDPLFSPVAREVRLGFGGEAAEADELFPGETVEKFLPAESADGGASLRYRRPDGAWAERTLPAEGEAVPFAAASVEFRFAALVREFGKVLRSGPPAAARLEELEHWARTTLPDHAGGYRGELLSLIGQARAAAGF